MKAVKHVLADRTVRLDITATAREVNEQFEESRAQFAFDMRLRPVEGKSLDEVARERLGVADLDSAVAPQVVDRLVPFALDKHDICPVDQPACTYDAPPRRGHAFAFSATVIPKPAFELESYEPVTVEVEPFVLDESLVDRELDHIVRRFVEFVPAEPGPVEPDSNCYIRLEAKMDGQRLSKLSTEGRVYSLGKGYMPQAFDDALLGMVPGEVRRFEFEAPRMGLDSGPHSRYECEVELIELRKRHVPELADEWVAEHVEGFDTLQQLREAKAAQVELAERATYEQSVKDKVVAAFSEQFAGEISEAAFDSTYNAVLADLKSAVRLQGKDFLEYVEEMGGEEQVDLAVSLRAKQALAQDYSLDALFRHYGLKVDECDLDAAARELNPLDPQAAREAMLRTGRGFALREVAARHRAARWLVEHSQVVVCGEGEQEV